jgi:hypothetical protein
MRFEFKPWMTKKNDFHNGTNKGVPVPLRVMFGNIVRQTDKAYYIEVCGKPEPTSICMNCGRELTHKVSMFYGLGPDCGKHFYISMVSEDAIEDYLDEVRKLLSNVTWRGIVPKTAVTVTPEDFHTIEFVYNATGYRVTTSDKTKIRQIHEKSSRIVSELVVQA